MLKVFTRSGIAFQYPASWTLEIEDDSDAWTVSVASPGTAFLTASLRPGPVSPTQVTDEALSVMKAEYKELDAEPVVESVGSLPAVGYNIDFLTLDTSIEAWLRCVSTAEGNLLILGQVSELDRLDYETVLKAMLQSVTAADEE